MEIINAEVNQDYWNEYWSCGCGFTIAFDKARASDFKVTKTCVKLLCRKCGNTMKRTCMSKAQQMESED